VKSWEGHLDGKPALRIGLLVALVALTAANVRTCRRAEHQRCREHSSAALSGAADGPHPDHGHALPQAHHRRTPCSRLQPGQTACDRHRLPDATARYSRLRHSNSRGGGLRGRPARCQPLRRHALAAPDTRGPLALDITASSTSVASRDHDDAPKGHAAKSDAIRFGRALGADRQARKRAPPGASLGRDRPHRRCRNRRSTPATHSASCTR